MQHNCNNSDTFEKGRHESTVAIIFKVYGFLSGHLELWRNVGLTLSVPSLFVCIDFFYHVVRKCEKRS